MTAQGSVARSLWTRRRRATTRHTRRFSGRAAALAIALTGTTIGGMATPGSAFAGDDEHGFRQVNLVSDLPVAQLLDPQVRNPWGIALGPTTPLWVANEHNPAGCDTCVPTPADLLTKITLYQGANGREPISKVNLEVTASVPTGIVFNPTTSFAVAQGNVVAPAQFLFNEVVLNAAGNDPLAKITGWTVASGPLPTTTASTRATKDGSVYTGLALVPAASGDSEHGNAQPILLAVDNVANTIDVYDGAFNRLEMPGAFVDPDVANMQPYNVAFLKGRVYVTYGTEGGGAVSVFSRDGRFIKRLATGAPLVDPWGMTIAPDDWGAFGGALLVGNVDDGKINAFNRRNGHLLGTISDAHGVPLVNPGLWGLTFGNGTIGTEDTLLFSAGIGSEVGGFGPDEYAHGLVGLIEPVEH